MTQQKQALCLAFVFGLASVEDLKEMKCTTEHQSALVEILQLALIEIRARNEESEFCMLTADHVHNIPQLIFRFKPELLEYYWEVEKPLFEKGMKKIGKTPSEAYLAPWKVLESFYEKHTGNKNQPTS